MDIGSLFLVLALALVVGLFIAQPFLQNSPRVNAGYKKKVESQEHTRSALLAEKDRVLDALQELDFDRALEKIPDEEYAAQRKSLLVHGTEALRELDQLEAHSETKGAEERLVEATSARHEAGSVNIGAGDAIEDQIAARRRARDENSAGFCPKCGRPLQKSDRFCPKCGTAL
jgi:hypothetical protein